ncbi:MAG: 50S ribosomal protein L15 [Planctomycetes bacterium]|nr:50S ribosomal protein L15 [Planctomycetota bacterium]
MKLNDVHQGIVGHKKLMRVGRGPGSGKGKTAGRGGKGQTARAGYKALSIFQGGATPLVRRIPKRGFTNSFALQVAAVNVGDLERVFQSGDEVCPEQVDAKHLVRHRFDLLKVLGNGELTKKLKVSAHRFSQSAREKIEKAGGEVVVLAGRTPVVEKQKRSKESAGK